MKVENPITFTQPCYILFNVDRQSCCTDSAGLLGIFTTKRMAEISADATAQKTGSRIAVLAVNISCIDELPI